MLKYVIKVFLFILFKILEIEFFNYFVNFLRVCLFRICMLKIWRCNIWWGEDNWFYKESCWEFCFYENSILIVREKIINI